MMSLRTSLPPSVTARERIVLLRHHRVGLDVAARRPHPADVTVLDVQPGDLDIGHDGQRTGLQGPLAHDGAGPQGVDHPHAGRPERADELVLLDERHLLLDEGGGDELGLDAPGLGARHPPAELLHPFRRAGDLEAAGLGEDAHLLVLLDRVEGQVRDLPRVVDGEDEVGRVPGGAAGVGQRSHVELDDVGPAETRQVVDEAVADDACADDDGLGVLGNGCHGGFSLVRNTQL